MKQVWRFVKRAICLMLCVLLLFGIGLAGYNQLCHLKERAELKAIGQTVEVNGKKLRLEKTGEGDQTIVLLSGLGTYEPILDFRPLAGELSADYQVVTIEYPGYGLSEDTSEARSSQNIVAEIRAALQQAEVKPPYILMPHSLSGFYVMEYVKEYPEEIAAVIGIEPSVPEQEKYEEVTPIPENLWYLSRAMDIIGETRLELRQDAMLEDMKQSGSYTEQTLQQMRAAKAVNSASKALIHENNAIQENAEKLYGVKYPENMPVLTFLSQESCKSLTEEFAAHGADISWEKLHSDLFLNTSIQKLSFLEGSHYLHWTAYQEIANQTKQFISQYVE